MTENPYQHVKFHPWVGDNYGENHPAFRQRTLILGGSHYDKNFEDFHNPEKQQEWANNTNDIVWCYLDQAISGTWKKTYSTFINSVYGQVANHDQRWDFFDSVIFYNYLQEIAGANAYEAGNFNYGDPKHFNAFAEVIEKYRPEVVISWGNKVWEGLPNDWGYGPAVKSDPIFIQGRNAGCVYTYPFEDIQIRLVGVKHPCSGFTRDFHHVLFNYLNLLA